MSDVSSAGRIGWAVHDELRKHALAWGFGGGTALLIVYVSVLAFANSLEHAIADFERLWYWMTPLVLGFAAQVGLFAYWREATRGKHLAHAHGVVASGGTTTVSMVACCAHHLTDVLPLIGLAGASLFLVQYQTTFLLLGLLSNVIGLVYVLGMLRRHGLFPERQSLLSLSVGWPVDRALLPVILVSAAVFVVAVIVAVTQQS
jgi:hypothetical protein